MYTIIERNMIHWFTEYAYILPINISLHYIVPNQVFKRNFSFIDLFYLIVNVIL